MSDKKGQKKNIKESDEDFSDPDKNKESISSQEVEKEEIQKQSINAEDFNPGEMEQDSNVSEPGEEKEKEVIKAGTNTIVIEKTNLNNEEEETEIDYNVNDEKQEEGDEEGDVGDNNIGNVEADQKE